MAGQHFVHQVHDDLVGVVCVTAAFKHAGVLRFQAQGKYVEGHVGARFENHRDYAHRHANFTQLQAIVQVALLQHFTHWRGQVCNETQIVTDGF